VSDEFIPGFRFRSDAHELWALMVESLRGFEQRASAVAADAGLSVVSAWALVQLDPEHPISQRELATRLHCDPSTVVDPTDRLERSGLIVRRPNPADRRVNVLTLTARGKAARKEIVARMFEPPAALRHLSPEDQARFREVMLDVVRRPDAQAGRGRVKRA
jgi:DNA-binding MarR family transcriptional regulator